MDMFQSTPHLSGKANAWSRVIGGILEVSIHASPQRQGERANPLFCRNLQTVSIHASPQRQGERRDRH